MKKYRFNLLSIIALFIIACVMSSCGERKPKNYFTIGSDVYELVYGSIINNGEENGTFNLDLRLYCENEKDFINFGIKSVQAESIESATYTDYKGSWVLGYTANGSYTNMGNIVSGKVVIDKSSDGYSIEIKCVDQYSNNIDGYFKGKLAKKDENNLVHVVPEYVLPEEIYDEVTSYFPVYSGITPPDMKGEYVSSPHYLVYQSDMDDNDSVQFFSDLYMGFIYNNKQMNYYSKQYNVEKNDYEENVNYGMKITGENDNFTCYYVVESYVNGYYAQQSFIFSGKKTDEGIEDFHTAVILLETSGHPNLPPKNTFRVLKDYDGLAEQENWMSKTDMKPRTKSGSDSFEMWMK